jgi:hypothetical protein
VGFATPVTEVDDSLMAIKDHVAVHAEESDENAKHNPDE